MAFVIGIGFGYKTKLPSNGYWKNDPIKSGPPPTETETALGLLLNKTPEEIEQTDIETIAWACLGGLPGTEKVTLESGRNRIQKLAQRVKDTTDASLKMDRAKNKNFQDTPEFRAYVLVAVLQQENEQAHLPEKYDPDHHEPWDGGIKRPEELFFHGGEMVHYPCLGNPILIVAVGQAVGLPIQLASSPGHLYARWDDGKTSFNIEESEKDVMEAVDDVKFRQFHPASDQDAKADNCYHSLNHTEVVAVCLQARGDAMRQFGDLNQAMVAYSEAHRLMPNVLHYTDALRSVIDTRLRSYNLTWKIIDDHNQDRFNLAPIKEPLEERP